MSYDGAAIDFYEPAERDLVRALMEIEDRGVRELRDGRAEIRDPVSWTQQIPALDFLRPVRGPAKVGFDPIASAEEIIEIARAGQPFLLTDRTDRENEGDLIIPAQFATPEHIAFMACECRGLICLALHKTMADKIGLTPAPRWGHSDMSTPFTQSIEARVGITTGISAHDRATTIAAAVNPMADPSSISSPGHIFPLIAQPGGVLDRDGHTEASVDIAMLAGCSPAAVICEVMNRDGTMARRDDLILFAKRHRLRIGTIEELTELRKRGPDLALQPIP